ncbi:hypothetical protein ACJX0J_009655, partial [Zea mays]
IRISLFIAMVRTKKRTTLSYVLNRFGYIDNKIATLILNAIVRLEIFICALDDEAFCEAFNQIHDFGYKKPTCYINFEALAAIVASNTLPLAAEWEIEIKLEVEALQW